MSPPTEAVGQARRRRGRSALPAALTPRVEVLEQLACRKLDLVRQVHNVLTEPWNKGVVARNCVGCTERPRSHVFRQNYSQEFRAGYLAAYRVEFLGQPGRSCGPWWRSSCRLWPRPSTWSRVECLVDSPSRRAGPMPRTTSCGAASTAPPGSTPNWSACSTAPPSASPTRRRDAPTMRKAFRHHTGRRDCRALRWRDRG